MSVSIVIVNYNTSKQIISCIDSLRGEFFDKIVVVDNASPNDNPDNILLAHPFIHLEKLPQNLGFGGGCNAGLDWVTKNTSSEFVFFLNPDTYVEVGLVKTLLNKFSDPIVGAVTPLITLADEKDILWYGGGEFSWFKGSVNVPECGKVYLHTIATQERFVSFASGCAVIFRRTLLEKLGGFDEKYFMYEEDAEISLNVLKHGYKILYTPEAVVRHIGQASQGDEQKNFWMYEPKNPKLTFFVYYTTRNRFYTVLKHGNFFQKVCFFIGFPGWIIRRGIPWLLYWRVDAFSALFKGIKDGVTTMLNREKANNE